MGVVDTVHVRIEILHLHDIQVIDMVQLESRTSRPAQGKLKAAFRNVGPQYPGITPVDLIKIVRRCGLVRCGALHTHPSELGKKHLRPGVQVFHSEQTISAAQSSHGKSGHESCRDIHGSCQQNECSGEMIRVPTLTLEEKVRYGCGAVSRVDLIFEKVFQYYFDLSIGAVAIFQESISKFGDILRQVIVHEIIFLIVSVPLVRRSWGIMFPYVLNIIIGVGHTEIVRYNILVCPQIQVVVTVVRVILHIVVIIHIVDELRIEWREQIP